MFAAYESLSLWLEQINQWILYLWTQIEQSSADLFTALKDRLLPMLIEYESVFLDPLWQALALLFLVVLMIFLGGRLLSIISQVIKYLFQHIIAFLKGIVDGLISPLKWLYAKFNQFKEQRTKTPFWQRLNIIQVRRTVKALQYLTTKKDWRYNTPWLLLIGESTSGKNELICAATDGRRTQLLPEEEKLKEPGSGWHFFEHAVVIVLGLEKVTVDTTHTAQSEADREQLTKVVNDKTNVNLPIPTSFSDQQYIDRFKHLIQLLHWYRPERPVDGIMLTVSANTLLRVNEPAVLQALGENLFKQLWQSQKQTGFVLPVYLIVTQCETIEGFEAFWQVQNNSRRDEIVGWSNPYRLDCAYCETWIVEAFTKVFEDLESAKLQFAASGQKINHIDQFMLFKHYFSQIQTPLTGVLNQTFARSSFQEALPLRGIYFTGKVDGKTSFINDLLSKKVFSEKYLAYPIERKRFSTQRVLRRFQFTFIFVIIAFVALMINDSVRLQSFTQDTQQKLSQLHSIESDCTPEGIKTYQLLHNLTEMNERPFLLSMPLSWMNTQENKEQRLVADTLITKVLFVSLACRLEIKAKELMSELNAEQADDYPQQLTKITQFTHLLVDYQKNRQRFIEMVEPLNSSKGIDKKLTLLLNYLYNVPVPASVDTSALLITGSIKKAGFKIQARDIDALALINHLGENTEKLHQLLLSYSQRVPLAQLKKISETINKTPKWKVLPASTLLKNIDILQAWLAQTEKDWLMATASNSPCGRVFEMLTHVEDELLKSEFNQDKLTQIADQFSHQHCDDVVRDNLVKIQISPFGKMFEFSEDNKLVLSSVLKKLSKQVGALESLNFVQSTYPPINTSSEKVVAWSDVPLQELLTILVNSQEFRAKHHGEAKPFFANNVVNRLQQVTERLFNKAQIRPSQQPFISYIGKVDGAESEAELEKSIASFMRVSESLIQIKRLLIQRGDNSNAIRLQQTVDRFILQQLAIAEQLISENKLYKPVGNPYWDERDFTRVLFNLSSDKQIQNFLANQQQRMSFIVFSYAEPLLKFLQNSASVSINDDVAQRWIHTINDLGRFQRKEPNNQVAILNHFISDTLVSLTNTNCFEHSNKFNTQVANVGWFAKRRQQLQRQVSVHCQKAGDTQIIDRYLAIKTRFNQELSGKFPFAKLGKAGMKDVSINQLNRFMEYYQQASKSLLTDMNAYISYKPDSMPASWYDFISQMDEISNFFQKNWNAKNKQWQVPLNVQFAALPQHAKGTNQIIAWTLTSGVQQLHFPNGNNSFLWQAGDPLSLELRWASGSAFVPKPNYNSAITGLTVKPETLSATFTSKGEWGLFEWLASYTTDELNNLRANQQNQSLLSFNVPVGLKGANNKRHQIAQASLSKPRQVSDISRANLLMWVEFINEQGNLQRLALPASLPTFAPGFND